MTSMVIAGQLSLFDEMVQENTHPPQFSNGQPVFILSLDVVIPGKIESSWICPDGRYGYGVQFRSGSHTVFWDNLIGLTAFKDKTSANRQAEQKSYQKILPEDLKLQECISYEYTRVMDGYRLTATLAKIGEYKLYEHAFMCYHFLRTYPSPEKRDHAYLLDIKKIKEEAESRSAIQLSSPALDVLYLVSDGLYASRGYADMHTDWVRRLSRDLSDVNQRAAV